MVCKRHTYTQKLFMSERLGILLSQWVGKDRWIRFRRPQELRQGFQRRLLDRALDIEYRSRGSLILDCIRCNVFRLRSMALDLLIDGTGT